MTQVIVLAKSSEVSTFVQFTGGLPKQGHKNTIYLGFAFSRKYVLMSGWTIHSTHGQLDPREGIRFDPCQESQLPGFHSTPHMRCSALALCSILNLLLPLFCILYWGFFVFLPFIPSGCSGSSISSVMGSVFSQALSSLVEHPTQTRSYCYSPGEG